MKTEFTEVQKFNQWWLWFLLVFVTLLPSIFFIYHYSSEKDTGSETISCIHFFLFLSVMALPLLLFWLMKLKTKVTRETIQMQFIPFVRKEVRWSEVQSAQVIDYGFVGGWGIRLWTKYGTVYNVKGSKGLALELKNGKKLLIGTQKELELSTIVDRLRGYSDINNYD